MTLHLSTNFELAGFMHLAMFYDKNITICMIKKNDRYWNTNSQFAMNLLREVFNLSKVSSNELLHRISKAQQEVFH